MTASRSTLRPLARAHPASGFTLPEMLLSMGLATLVALAAFVLYSSSHSSAGADVEQSNVDQISQVAYQAYGPLGTYHGLTTATAITDGVIPPSMVRNPEGATAATAASIWDTPVTVGPATAAGVVDAGLAITYAEVPSAACVQLVSGVSDGMWDIKVAGTSVMKDVWGRGSMIISPETPLPAVYRVLDFDLARSKCLASPTPGGSGPEVVFIRYDQTVGSQLVAGADSRNLLWSGAGLNPGGGEDSGPGAGLGGGDKGDGTGDGGKGGDLGSGGTKLDPPPPPPPVFGGK